MFIPNIRCLKDILWDRYRFFEFTSSNDIDQFKNHYKNLENFNNLNWDVQLFKSLLEISGVESVSLTSGKTVCIKKLTSSDWEEINKKVQKAFYKFLEIPSEDRK